MTRMKLTAAHFAAVSALALSATIAGTASAAPKPAVPAAAPAYRIVAEIAGEDGGWDYAVVDPVHRRLYQSRRDGVMALDLDTGRVTPRLVGGDRARAEVLLPDGQSVLAAMGGSNEAVIYDGASGEVRARIPVKAPDGAVVDPTTGLVWVMRKTGQAALIDPKAGRQVGETEIGGELEFPVTDGKGRIFVNVADANAIAVVDTRSRKVVAHYKLRGCDGPTGMAYAARQNVLISVCENGVAKVLDAASGREISSVAVGRGADAVILDDQRNLAFVPAGDDGVLSVLSIGPAGRTVQKARIKTRYGVATGALDPTTGKVYLSAAAYAPKDAHGERAQLPGSYRMLVVSNTAPK